VGTGFPHEALKSAADLRPCRSRRSAVLEGVDEYTTADGKHMALPYAGVLEFRGEQIAGWRDYVDLGVLTDQKVGKPFSPQVNALLDRTATTPAAVN
jgi:hypothetical protein